MPAHLRVVVLGRYNNSIPNDTARVCTKANFWYTRVVQHQRDRQPHGSFRHRPQQRTHRLGVDGVVIGHPDQPVARPRVGVVVELRPLAPSDDATEPRLVLPRRTPQPAPVSCLLAAKPVDLRVSGWIPMSTPTKSVTVSRIESTTPGPASLATASFPLPSAGPSQRPYNVPSATRNSTASGGAPTPF